MTLQEFFDARIETRTNEEGQQVQIRFVSGPAKYEVKLLPDTILYYGISEEEAVGVFYHGN